MNEEMIRNEFMLYLEDMPQKWQKKSIGAIEKILRKYDFSVKENALTIQQGSYSDAIVEIYLRLERARGRSDESVYNYELTLKAFFAYCNGKRPDEVTSVDIIQYLCDYKEQRNISYTTLNDKHVHLSSFFLWCYKTGYCSKNPVDLVPRFKIEKKQREYLNGAELEELRLSCESLRERALLEFMVSSACRISEICDIQLCDVNWTTNTIKVTGKGNKQRTVIMTPKCRMAVDDYLASRGYGKARRMKDLNKTQQRMQRRIKRKKCVLDRKKSKEFLFPAKKTKAHPDGHATEHSLRDLFEKIVERTSFNEAKWVTPHTMRHTWATLAKQRGMRIEDISTYLGHENISTTMIYITIDPENVCRDVVKYAV